MIHNIFFQIQRKNNRETCCQKGRVYSHIKSFVNRIKKIPFYKKSYKNYKYYSLSNKDFLLVFINQGIKHFMVLLKYFISLPALMVSLW